MVAEIGWGAQSKYFFMRKPMMLHSCFVAVTKGSQFYGYIEPRSKLFLFGVKSYFFFTAFLVFSI